MIRILIIMLSVFAFSSYIFAQEDDSDPTEIFMRKCHTEWDMIVMKKYKGDDERIAGELEMNKIMAPMIKESIEGWYRSKSRWEDAKADEDSETMKEAASYCNDTRKLTMKVCPKHAKTLPVLKTE